MLGEKVPGEKVPGEVDPKALKLKKVRLARLYVVLSLALFFAKSICRQAQAK